MPCQSHSLSINHPDSIVWTIQIMNLLAIQFSPILFYFSYYCIWYSLNFQPARFEVCTAVKIYIILFFVTAPFNSVRTYQCFTRDWETGTSNFCYTCNRVGCYQGFRRDRCTQLPQHPAVRYMITTFGRNCCFSSRPWCAMSRFHRKNCDT